MSSLSLLKTVCDKFLLPAIGTNDENDYHRRFVSSSSGDNNFHRRLPPRNGSENVCSAKPHSFENKPTMKHRARHM